jgi:hypothetical protein
LKALSDLVSIDLLPQFYVINKDKIVKILKKISDKFGPLKLDFIFER